MFESYMHAIEEAFLSNKVYKTSENSISFDTIVNICSPVTGKNSNKSHMQNISNMHACKHSYNLYYQNKLPSNVERWDFMVILSKRKKCNSRTLQITTKCARSTRGSKL